MSEIIWGIDMNNSTTNVNDEKHYCPHTDMLCEFANESNYCELTACIKNENINNIKEKQTIQLETLRKSLMKSIYKSLLEYKYIHHKEPDCIIMNKISYDILTLGWDVIISNNFGLGTIYNIPIRISNDAIDEMVPKFWLCEEGIITNFE